MARQRKVERPIKRSEYTIEHATREAEKGWRDLLSTTRGPTVDAWDFLTRTPEDVTPRNYRLRGSQGTITKGGQQFDRWQYKPTVQGDARIWFYVDGQTVYLERVDTHHPNETK